MVNTSHPLTCASPWCVQTALAQLALPQGTVIFVLFSHAVMVPLFLNERSSWIIQSFLTSACMMASVKAAGLEKVMHIWHPHSKHILVSFLQTWYSLFTLLNPHWASHRIRFPMSLLDRAQMWASRQNPRVEIQTQGQVGVLVLSLLIPVTLALGHYIIQPFAIHL